jgi:hypothetical protein
MQRKTMHPCRSLLMILPVYIFAHVLQRGKPVRLCMQLQAHQLSGPLLYVADSCCSGLEMLLHICCSLAGRCT